MRRPRATTRRTDPETSHEAAESVNKGDINRGLAAALQALRMFGPCSDEHLQENYDVYREDLGWPIQVCIRKRRKDLEQAGLAEWTGEKVKNSNKRNVRVYRAAS